MLRMALLGLLILLSVGMLSAMELRAPPRRAIAIVQPLAEQNADISASHDALAKADRLEVAAVSSEMPTQAALVEDRVAPQDIHIGSSKPVPIARHRHHSKKITSAERPKPKPKATVIKRTANFQRSKAAGDTEPCRLKAFGALKAFFLRRSLTKSYPQQDCARIVQPIADLALKRLAGAV